MSLDMMNDIGIDKKEQLYIIKKMMSIAIRATYYIFCYRNRTWDSLTILNGLTNQTGMSSHRARNVI